jgi:hypothetical protein
MAKATPEQIKRDHAISRKDERKGLDKKNARVYTLSTIKLKLKEGISKMANKSNKTEQAPAKPAKKNNTQGIPVHGVMGLALLFVVASIVYANYVVFFGTQGLIPKLMLIPSSIFVLAFLVHKSVK